MKMHRIAKALIAFSALSGLVSSSQYSRADSDCIPRVLEAAFESKPAATRISLPELAPASLGSVERKVLKHHPIREFAAELPGKKIAFQSFFFDEKIDPFYKGEMIQARYVKAVLSKLVPGAKYIKNAADAKSRTVFPLTIVDIGEHGAKYPDGIEKTLERGEVLPMHLLKPVGSRKEIPLSKEEIRRRLGFTPNQKVVSLYIRAEDTLIDTNPRAAGSEKYTELFSALKSAYDYDAVILSFGNFSRNTAPSPLYIAMRSKGSLSKAVKLTEVLQGKVGNIEKGTLIKNNTKEMMPYLHAAADVAVVVGPVNFFEPVFSGTKTVLVKYTGSLTQNSNYSGYNKGVLDQTASLAESTGALVSVDNLNEIGNGVKRVLRKAKAVDTEKIREQTFTAFLDQLHKHLEHQLPAELSEAN